MAPTTQLPPRTLIEPVTDILHGVPVIDPYRWLEDQSSLRTRKWIDEQSSYARQYLDARPGRDQIKERVQELLAVEVTSDPWKVGTRYFYLKREAHEQQPAIMMREIADPTEITLVNPAERGEGHMVSVSIVSISPDGDTLAYGLKRDGTDSQAVEFFRVPDRQILPDRLPNGLIPAIVFLPKMKGFYYSHETAHTVPPYRRAVYWHQFGSQATEDVEVFVAGEDPDLHVGVFGSSNGEFLGYLVSRANDPMTFDLYLTVLTNGGQPRKILDRIPSLFCPFFAGTTLLALTDYGAPNRRIVRISPEYPEPDGWFDVVPECSERIENFSLVNGFVCVGYVEGNSSRIELFSLKGAQRQTVPCPPRGTSRLIRRLIDSDSLFYEFSSFAQPTTVYSYRPAYGECKILCKSRAVFKPSTVDFVQVRYRSKDGTEIPMFLVADAKQRATGPLPTILTGYGGFGFSYTPQFRASWAVMLEHGLLLAIANVRGGGELGKEWHRAGKRNNRQNAVDDFISAAEWLIGNRHTQAGRIAISGGSNAGLLVGAALTQRPDLFRAVVCSGPLLDMLRYHLFDFANRWVDEYGSAEKEEDFPHLRAYSPYHNVDDCTYYPAVMFVSGDADTRCNPMHARKMTARLQAATISEHPVLLSYATSWGHVAAQPIDVRVDAVTDRLAFIFHELDIGE